MQVKSHGVTGSGIMVRKSAGKTDRIETLDGYGQALEKEGSFARIRRDRGYSLADFANEMLAFFTDRAKGLNGYRHKKVMSHQLSVFSSLALSGCCGGCTGCGGGD